MPTILFRFKSGASLPHYQEAYEATNNVKLKAIILGSPFETPHSDQLGDTTIRSKDRTTTSLPYEESIRSSSFS